jgi:hypothetical protein
VTIFIVGSLVMGVCSKISKSYMLFDLHDQLYILPLGVNNDNVLKA